MKNVDRSTPHTHTHAMILMPRHRSHTILARAIFLGAVVDDLLFWLNVNEIVEDGKRLIHHRKKKNGQTSKIVTINKIPRCALYMLDDSFHQISNKIIVKKSFSNIRFSEVSVFFLSLSSRSDSQSRSIIMCSFFSSSFTSQAIWTVILLSRLHAYYVVVRSAHTTAR